jgi:hypothetical protein
MPGARRRTSSAGCPPVDDAPRQAKRDHAIVAQLPDPLVWIPRRSCPLQPVTSGPAGKGDAQADDVVWGKARWWRFPVALRDKELYGFEPLLPLRIGAIPHADEEVAVLCEELLRAFLARPEVEPEPRGVELKGNLGECTAGGRPGQGTRRGAVRIAGAWLMNREKRGTRRGSSRTVHEPDKSLRIWFIPWLTPRRGYSDARRPRNVPIPIQRGREGAPWAPRLRRCDDQRQPHGAEAREIEAEKPPR